jgi:TonB family protein
VVGWGNSENPKNPVKFKAAISYLRTTKPEWNDDTWAADSTEIVNFSESVTGIIIEYREEKPRFEGQDANHFSKWVNERLTYPDEALEDAVTGRVTLQFKIDMFGNLEGLKVLRGRHPALDSIALNVVSSSPKWTPAKNRMGDPCSVVYVFTVIFTPEMMFEAFITKMYNEKLYEDYDFLQKHCSPELLKKLQDAYPYDSDDPAYATWQFRSGQQDIKPSSDDKTMILDVTADGDWYTYKALDMGWEFTNRIKLTSKDGKIIIEDMDLTGEWAKAFVRNSYLYHWHKTQDIDSTVMAFCELAKYLMPDIQLDPSAIKAYIMSAEKENAIAGEGEDLLNIVTAGKYYTPLCRCDIYTCIKDQMSEEALAVFYNVYDSWKTDLKTALRAVKDKCYREISLELYGNDHDIIGNREIVRYLIITEN